MAIRNGEMFQLIIYAFILEELVKERAKFKASEQEAKKLKNELHQVIADADGYKAAAALSEKSQKEELDSLHNKYQEEIVSLQHIMSGKFVVFCVCLKQCSNRHQLQIFILKQRHINLEMHVGLTARFQKTRHTQLKTTHPKFDYHFYNHYPFACKAKIY